LYLSLISYKQNLTIVEIPKDSNEIMLYKRLIEKRNHFLQEIDQLLVKVAQELTERKSSTNVELGEKNKVISCIRVTAPIKYI
jgi:hypothetical protein